MREKLIDIVEDYADFLDWDRKDAMVDSIMEFLATDNNVGSKLISVKDRLPEKDGRYLVYDGDTGNYYDSYYDETEGEFGEWQNCFDPFTLGVIDCEWNSCPNVTHWMPLPEAQKGD